MDEQEHWERQCYLVEAERDKLEAELSDLRRNLRHGMIELSDLNGRTFWVSAKKVQMVMVYNEATHVFFSDEDYVKTAETPAEILAMMAEANAGGA